MTTFGAHLKSLRKSRGLSQDELGERADLNAKYLGELERGVGNPSLEVLQRLASALHIPLATLVGDDTLQMGRVELIAEVSLRCNDLSDGRLRDFVRLLRLTSRDR